MRPWPFSTVVVVRLVGRGGVEVRRDLGLEGGLVPFT
jgi:hypothetical protein